MSTSTAIIAASAAFALVFLIFELLRSKYVIRVVKTTVVVPELPDTFEGTTIALVSDLHEMRFGEYNAVLAKKIKLEQPEYIFFAGDMGDSNRFNVSAFYDLLETLGTDVPIVAIPGNHDLRLGNGHVHRNFVSELEKSDVILLDNGHVEILAGDKKVYLYGYCQNLRVGPEKITRWPLEKVTAEDLSGKLGICPADAPVILLTHDPSGFKRYAEWGAAMVMAGHIHGGLVRLPLLGGLLSPDRIFFPKYHAGLYKEHGAQMYVTRGLAAGQLFRFGNAPEISLLTLVSPRRAASVAHKPSVKKEKGELLSEKIKRDKESLGALLAERSNQISDFFARLFGRDRHQSRYSKRADEIKRRNTYTAEDYRRRMGIKENESKPGREKGKKRR